MASEEVEFLPDGSVRFNSGQVISNVHGAAMCADRHCPIHNPSDHALRGHELIFDGKYMVRIVAGEPVIDPDDYLYNRHGYALLRNSAVCLNCGDEITSEYRHDYKTCSCNSIQVDGGRDYIRHGWTNANLYENTSIEFSQA